jgi:hypothetical protein
MNSLNDYKYENTQEITKQDGSCNYAYDVYPYYAVSNAVHNSGLLGYGFLLFSSVPTCRCWDRISNEAMTASSHSLYN